MNQSLTTQGESSPSILVVDDTPATLRLLTDHLLTLGYRISVAGDGEEAVTRAALIKPSLILMDVMMPGMDGYTAARQLKLRDDTRHIPVIFMTSLHDTESKVKGFEAGAVDYVTKPLQLDEVTARIHTHITLRELRRDLEEQNSVLEREVSERLRAEAALRQVNSQLDQRVQERTAQLLATNARLLAEIQERQKAQSQLLQAQKMEAFGQLAGGIAHDFNNILTVIIGQAQCLEFAPRTIETYEAAIAEILEAADRAKNLTRQLLVFSRRQSMVKAQVDLVSLTRDLSKMLRRLIGEDIQLSISSPLPSLLVDADASMIEQVLVNLSVNARDAMPKGGSLSIEVTRGSTDLQSPPIKGVGPGEHALIRVRDTGSGIPPNIRDHIFEPFFTTKPSGSGTGLGLAICSSIVQQHGGGMDLVTEEGQGSEFRIWLPLRGLSSDPSLTPRLASSLPRGHELILVVEDEEAVRRSTRAMLERFGYQVLEAVNGDEALSLWRKHGPRIDLLVSDIVMPGSMNGRELALRLKAEKPSLRVLLVSGYDPGMIDRKAPAPGSKHFHLLPKPFSIEKLITAVSAEFGRG